MKWEEKLTPASIKDNNRTSHQEMTILVAEDYQSNYDLIEAMLGKMYKLVHAHDGMEAIIFYEQYKPDLILMDIKICLFFIYPVHNLHSGTFHLRLLLR